MLFFLFRCCSPRADLTATRFPYPARVLSVYLYVHISLMGAAVAGVTLAATNVAMKLSPKGSAAAYIATIAMLTSLFAGIAPIIGGTLADFRSDEHTSELKSLMRNPNSVFCLKNNI